MASPIISVDKVKKTIESADEPTMGAAEEAVAQSGGEAATPVERTASSPEQTAEGAKAPLKKPLGLSLRKPNAAMPAMGESKPAPSPRSPIEEAIELALSSASTAVDSAQEIQRLRAEVQTVVKGAHRSSMILFYTTLILIVAGSVGLFGSLVFYKRSYNEFEAVARVNRDALLTFAGEINGLVATSKKIEESVKSTERALATTTAQSEELKKAMQGFTGAHNALTAKIPPAGAYDKPMAALKQSMDELAAASKAISTKLAEMQQAQIVRDQTPPPPPVEKPKVEAVKKPVAPTQSVQSGRDSMIRYP
jgi:hypothetical protein